MGDKDIGKTKGKKTMSCFFLDTNIRANKNTRTLSNRFRFWLKVGFLLLACWLHYESIQDTTSTLDKVEYARQHMVEQGYTEAEINDKLSPIEGIAAKMYQQPQWYFTCGGLSLLCAIIFTLRILLQMFWSVTRVRCQREDAHCAPTQTIRVSWVVCVDKLSVCHGCGLFVWMDNVCLHFCT